MTATTIPAREFTRNVAGAKRAARKGPVLITERGEPQFALLSMDEYRRLEPKAGQAQSLWELMQSLPDTSGIEFEPPKLDIKLQIPDFD
jgi:prevent-host-death family protein